MRLQVARGGANHLQFAVVDMGRGIAEEEKALVFQAFRQRLQRERRAMNSASNRNNLAMKTGIWECDKRATTL